ncbi:MAG: NADH-quinone oxidoreductase subunit C [Vampirovibrionales bacterium]|nr:NADH-quinone oxidoreductase subunit C [Vampirovibrionales bacterium]
MSETPTPPEKAPAATEKAAPPEPKVIPPGPIGQQLQAAGLAITPLGNDATGHEMIDVPPEQLPAVAQKLKTELKFDLLVCVTALDLGASRASMVHLMQTVAQVPEAKPLTVVLKTAATPAGQDADGYDVSKVPSLMPVYPAADWHEREAFDLMGIIYEGHPNLRRILMPDAWMGYPLRKNYKEEDPRLVWNRR